MSSPGTLRFSQVNTKPSAPPVGYDLIYCKTDNILYIQDSSGTEIPLGSAAAILSLSGEATGTGPGNAVVTLSNSAVIGKVLTGFTTGPNSIVLATDTILQAFQKLQAQVSGTTGTAITALTGDVSATGPGSVTATVNSVGGKTASDIASAVTTVDAATSINTASTLVERDASGNFAANIITATLNGNASTSTNFTGSLSGDVSGTQTTTSVDKIKGTSVNATVPTDAQFLVYQTGITSYKPASLSADVSITDTGVATVNSVGGKSAAAIATSVTTTQAATSSDTPNTLVLRDGSGNFAASIVSTTGLEVNDSSGTSTVYIKTASVSEPSFTIKRIASQTGDLFQILDNSGNPQVIFDASGNFKFYNNVASPEARMDLRPSVNVLSSSTGAAARYSIFIGDPTQPEVAGTGAGLALGADYDNTGDATEMGIIWVTKNNATNGDFGAGMHFATRNNASGKAQRVLDMDSNGNSTFSGSVAQNGSTSGTLTQAVPATVTSYTITWPSAQGAVNTVLTDDGSGNLSWSAPTISGMSTLPSGDIWVGNGSNIATAEAPSGDVSMTNTGSFTVNTVGGSSAANIHSAELAANAATSANTPNTIVKRDGSGNFSAGTITANLTGNVSGTAANVTGVVAIANGGTNNSSAYTAGSIIFSNGTSLTQDNANFFWNDVNESIGIGTNTPVSSAFIDGVNSSGSTKRIQLTGYGAAVGNRGRYANGTVGSPTAAVNTNILEFISGQGYGSTGFPAASTAAMDITAAATFTDTSMPTDINFSTTPVGSVTAVQTVQFSHTGGVTLGPTSSTGINQFNGGTNRTNKTITANYTVDTTTTDDIIYCNASGAITVTLPTPTNGRTLVIKDISGTATANNITIARHASEKIENLSASYVMQVSFETVIISSDGTNWWIF